MKVEELVSLDESGLSRVLSHLKSHDSGSISAFRSKSDCNRGETFSKKENLQRNRSLVSKLKNAGFYVTSIKGSYIENFGTNDPIEVKENSFLVVDMDDKGNLKDVLMKVGEYFEQDSILFMPKGAESAELVGTSPCHDQDLDLTYGQVKHMKNPVFGKSNVFMSRVKGRPFYFKECTDLMRPPKSVNSKYVCHSQASKDWWEITDEELSWGNIDLSNG